MDDVVTEAQLAEHRSKYRVMRANPDGSIPGGPYKPYPLMGFDKDGAYWFIPVGDLPPPSPASLVPSS